MRIFIASLCFSFGFAGTVLGNDDPFTKPPVWRIQIEIAKPKLEKLRVQPRKYVPAKIQILGESLVDCGIHLKGTGTFQTIDEKPSFTIDFGKFVRGQAFRGLEKIHLNNSLQDPTYLKEQIGSEIFLLARIPAPRVAHALVALNGRQLGFYVLKEGFTEDFLGRHFKGSNGHLYDTDEGHDVDQRMKRQLGPPGAKDQAELRRAAAAAAERDPLKRWELLGQAVDLERFASFMAVEVMICHWDGYCLAQNNFRIYHDPGSDKLVFLPSGMDQIFSKPDLPWKPGMSGLIARAWMETAEGRALYERTFRSLFEEIYDSTRLSNRVHQLVLELRPFLSRREFESLRQESFELAEKIVARANYLRDKLAEPELRRTEFPRGTARVSGWKAHDVPIGGVMRETRLDDGRSYLMIAAGPKTSASWRAKVLLGKGRYEFRARARVEGVQPLPFGEHQGASARIVGKPGRSKGLTGTSDREELAVQFGVESDEEEVILALELRAAAGKAWFEIESAQLRRTEP